MDVVTISRELLIKLVGSETAGVETWSDWEPMCVYCEPLDPTEETYPTQFGGKVAHRDDCPIVLGRQLLAQHFPPQPELLMFLEARANYARVMAKQYRQEGEPYAANGAEDDAEAWEHALKLAKET